MNEETRTEYGAVLSVQNVSAVADRNTVVDAIGAAEDICDPLDGLVEQCAADPGAVRRSRLFNRKQIGSEREYARLPPSRMKRGNARHSAPKTKGIGAPEPNRCGTLALVLP